MTLGLVTAFLGGVVGVFSPCNALLLPAFFAHTTTSSRRLLPLGAFFLVGLMATLVPLGAGLGWLGGQLSLDRGLLLTLAGWVIVALGVLHLVGAGFDLGRVLPWSGRARSSGAGGSLPGAFLLGTVAGVAGFCTGPVLGAVLTVVMTTADPVEGAVLLGAYALGTGLPIIGLAGLWRRFGRDRFGWLRGRMWALGPGGRIRLHSNRVIGGLLFIVVGVVFLLTGGLAGVPELLPHQVSQAITDGGRAVDAVLGPVAQGGWVSIAELAGMGMLAWWTVEAVPRIRRGRV